MMQALGKLALRQMVSTVCSSKIITSTTTCTLNLYKCLRLKDNLGATVA